MRDALRPMGRFFCLLKLSAATFVIAATMASQTNGPVMTRVLEGLFGHKSGTDKKNTAMTLALNTIQATDAIAGKDIVDASKIQDGMGKVIDGIVLCLNASAWSKTKQA